MIWNFLGDASTPDHLETRQCSKAVACLPPNSISACKTTIRVRHLSREDIKPYIYPIATSRYPRTLSWAGLESRRPSFTMPQLLQLARPLARISSSTPSATFIRTLTTHTPSKRFDMPAPAKPSARKTTPRTYPEPELPKLSGSLPPPSKTTDELLAAGSPYLLRRTAYGKLPVYRRWRGGGTLEEVLVKKIEGNPKPLVQDLTAMLGCAPEHVKINPTTNQIVIKVCTPEHGLCLSASAQLYLLGSRTRS